MSFYDKFVDSVRSLKLKLSKDPTTANIVSGALAAELTIIVCLLISAILLRHISIIASVIMILFIAVLLFTNMPIAPKLKKEQDDSLNKMTFYVIITLGVLIAAIYWGLKYV